MKAIRLDRRAVLRPANDNRKPSPLGFACFVCGCDMVNHRHGDEAQCWRCGRWQLLPSAFGGAR